MDRIYFKFAKPIWPEKLEYEKNLTIGFKALFEKPTGGNTILKVTASSLYRFFVNGKFIGHGPARGPHGYYRVDEWDITECILSGLNVLAVEVVGYNVNSYYLLDQPSFIQAEVVCGNMVTAYTSSEIPGFTACICKERVQKVQRYSFQRTFIEAYKLVQDFDYWRTSLVELPDMIKCIEGEEKQLLPRGVSYPLFDVRFPITKISEGTIETGCKPSKYWKDRSFVNIGESFKGYREEELELHLSNEIQEMIFTPDTDNKEVYANDTKRPIEFLSNTFQIFDFGINSTGFIGLKVECFKETRLLCLFDEILSDGDVDFKRLECVNAICFDMQEGSYMLESFEPYTLRFLKIAAIHGQCELDEIYLREYANSDANKAEFTCSNNHLNEIFEAGRETFRQNAVDIYMDCPSRERAGWLCDSFFISRVENDLTGNSSIEHNFFENYQLPDHFDNLPDGMLPMCYPADHPDGVFIPNWALWFVVQLEEYLYRSRDQMLVDKLRGKVYRLFKYFHRFKNESGLLEGLENWVFVEWSKANDWVQDVNFPTNMLYAGALAAAGRIYEDEALLRESHALKSIVCNQSYNGSFFVDNCMREDGVLKRTNNVSEVCQYYAFFFNIATPESHSELWKKLVGKFSVQDDEDVAKSKVFPANAFIGNYLRLEVLSRYGLADNLIDEMEGFFTYMIKKTGTLWENITDYASCNHGFASHVVHCLYRDALGIKNIDPGGKCIEIHPGTVDLEWCEGRLPVGASELYIRWWKEAGNIKYRIKEPEGYKVVLVY